MKINQKHFYEFNFQDFVHVKYLKHVLKDVARIIADNIPEHKTIDDLQFKTDQYGEQELHVTYTDFENQSHDVLMKPAITDRVNELIDKRFRWIEAGDEPIKKLEIKNHYFRITTDSTTADFEVPYIFNAGIEQDQLHFDRDGEEYIKIKLVARNTHDEVTLEVPTKKNFDDLKADYEKFKEAFYTWQTEVNNHLAEIDKKDKEQDGRLTDVEQKNTEQDERLTDVEQKNTEQDERLTDVEQKNTEQDERLTDVEQKNTEQDNEIAGIKDHQTSVDSIIAILQQKSHDFLQQLKNPADFNEIKDDGNYFVYADDTPDNHLTGANRPSDHWGILYNYKHEPSNQVQIYAADTDNVLYMRTLNSSYWTAWQAVTTSTALKDAISELTKTLFNFYYDGLATETSVDGKPVAAKAMIINDDKNLFKGVAVFNQGGELLKRIMLDDYATKEDVENNTEKITPLVAHNKEELTQLVPQLKVNQTLLVNGSLVTADLIKQFPDGSFSDYDYMFIPFLKESENNITSSIAIPFIQRKENEQQDGSYQHIKTLKSGAIGLSQDLTFTLMSNEEISFGYDDNNQLFIDNATFNFNLPDNYATQDMNIELTERRIEQENIYYSRYVTHNAGNESWEFSNVILKIEFRYNLNAGDYVSLPQKLNYLDKNLQLININSNKIINFIYQGQDNLNNIYKIDHDAVKGEQYTYIIQPTSSTVEKKANLRLDNRNEWLKNVSDVSRDVFNRGYILLDDLKTIAEHWGIETYFFADDTNKIFRVYVTVNNGAVLFHDVPIRNSNNEEVRTLLYDPSADKLF